MTYLYRNGTSIIYLCMQISNYSTLGSSLSRFYSVFYSENRSLSPFLLMSLIHRIMTCSNHIFTSYIPTRDTITLNSSNRVRSDNRLSQLDWQAEHVLLPCRPKKGLYFLFLSPRMSADIVAIIGTN